jgi:hypothetical protein
VGNGNAEMSPMPIDFICSTTPATGMRNTFRNRFGRLRLLIQDFELSLCELIEPKIKLKRTNKQKNQSEVVLPQAACARRTSQTALTSTIDS